MSDMKSPWAKQEDLKKQVKSETPQVDRHSLNTHYEVWKKAQNPTNASKVLEQLQPDIDASLRTYGGKNAEDFRTQANLLALEAVESYDPKKEAGLRTHVQNYLHKLTRIRNQRTDVLHIPENVHMERQELQKISDEFQAEYDREPNMQELADRSKFSIKQIKRIRGYKDTLPETTFTSEEGDLMSGKNRTAQQMWLDYVYFELDPIDKKIYEWSTGYGGVDKIPKSEIASRLKISAPAVSKRINKILSKIEEGQDLNA